MSLPLAGPPTAIRRPGRRRGRCRRRLRLVVSEYRNRLEGGHRPPAAAVTISVKNVPGLGPVLVNGRGLTLYLLTSEKGGKITCTNSNGCTQVWPETVLSQGMTTVTVGAGVRSSLLGTVKDASGRREATYNHWPLYTFAGDAGPGVAHGQRLTSFGGTWYVLNAAGNPVTDRPSRPGSSRLG
jgi:predicted lipoprotein with Yx(FWY)xxD motif